MEADMALEQYRPLVHKICMKYRGFVRDRSIGYDDLYQSGLIGLYYASQKYDETRGEASFFTYAYRAISRRVQRCINSGYYWVKAMKDTTRFASSLDAELSEDGGMTMQDLLPAAPDDLSAVHVQEFLSTLSERDRDIVTRRMSGETLGEISDIYGLSRERIRQILIKMQSALGSGAPPLAAVGKKTPRIRCNPKDEFTRAAGNTNPEERSRQNAGACCGVTGRLEILDPAPDRLRRRIRGLYLYQRYRAAGLSSGRAGRMLLFGSAAGLRRGTQRNCEIDGGIVYASPIR